jgi:hypothetical protein
MEVACCFRRRVPHLVLPRASRSADLTRASAGECLARACIAAAGVRVGGGGFAAGDAGGGLREKREAVAGRRAGEATGSGAAVAGRGQSTFRS